MNKKVKWNAVHIIAWILMAALLAGIIPANQIIVPAASVITASAEKPDDSGKCGENVKWEFFEEEGLLVISGKGDMINYSYCPPTPPVDRDPEIIPGDPPQKPYSLTLPTEREDEIIPGRVQTDLGFEANSKRVLSEAWQTVDDSSPETLPVEDPPWEKYVSKIQRIRIEEGVTSIGAVSFDNCEALADVEIAGSVTKIGPGAFSGDVKLTSVGMPISVENMGEGVFSGCSSLTDVQLPENMHYVPASMFSGCTSLQSVRLP